MRIPTLKNFVIILGCLLEELVLFINLLRKTSNYVPPLLVLLGVTIGLTPGAVAYETSFATDCRAFDDGLRVSFLNVGQGSSTLIRCPDGRSQLLIDAGSSDNLYPGGEALFQDSFLARMEGDTTLEHALLSHPDPDHLQGFKFLSERVRHGKLRIENYYDNGADHADSSIEEDTRAELQRQKTRYRNLSQTPISSIPLCQKSSIAFETFLPDAETAENLGCPTNLNDCSIVGRIAYQGVRFLLLSDTTLRWEAISIKKGAPALSREAEIIGVGHHASLSTSNRLLKTVQPSIAAISVGQPRTGSTETYCYPRPGVIRRLKRSLKQSRYGAALPRARIESCEPRKGKRIWKTETVPMSIWSTADMGTVDMYAKDGAVCIRSEYLSNALIFRF